MSQHPTREDSASRLSGDLPEELAGQVALHLNNARRAKRLYGNWRRTEMT